MGSHPINLGLRFLLELIAIGAFAIWGWRATSGPLRFLLAVGLPIMAMACWGIFAVPDDSSRSGGAPVPVPGSVRLLLELAFFGAGAFALYTAVGKPWGIGFALVVILHYVISYERVGWLLNH